MKKVIYMLCIGLMPVLLSFSLGEKGKSKVVGTVKDVVSGEKILFATVTAFKDGILIKGVQTDIDGKFEIKLEPGKYDLECSYIGYSAQKISNIVVEEKKTTKLDFMLSEGMMLDCVEIINYRPAKTCANTTTTGSTVTKAAKKKFPTKDISALAASVSGIKVKKEEEIEVRGARTNATIFYQDGIRVSGLVPDGAILNEAYEKIVENKPQNPFREPLSTFSIDVDRASYSNVRRLINEGNKPPKDAVRIEEMINYFNYEYDGPKSKNKPFKTFTQLTECPWNEDKKILHIGIQGKRINVKKLPASNLVLLVDVSGSMNSHNKLPLVKKSMKMLVDNLRKKDRVAIVTYAGSAGLVLPSTPASQKEKIINAIESLGAGGSTAGAEGILTAYDVARKNFIQGGNNRVLLATDGDFNVGVSSPTELEKLIEKERRSGVFLSVLGYGRGNYKDDRMQTLANKGNGNHSYIDDEAEARKVLVKEFGGTLHTIAKDVKIQIEFNPAYVQDYRLIGYENRVLANKDFTDDTKDAGELGAGHSVTALYEITPISDSYATTEAFLNYQKRGKTLKENGELATIKLRYKAPDGHKSWEIKDRIKNKTISLNKVSEKTIQALAVTEFGLLLRDSDYKNEASYGSVLVNLKGLEKKDKMVEELIELVGDAEKLSKVK